MVFTKLRNKFTASSAKSYQPQTSLTTTDGSTPRSPKYIDAVPTSSKNNTTTTTTTTTTTLTSTAAYAASGARTRPRHFLQASSSSGWTSSASDSTVYDSTIGGSFGLEHSASPANVAFARKNAAGKRTVQSAPWEETSGSSTQRTASSYSADASSSDSERKRKAKGATEPMDLTYSQPGGHRMVGRFEILDTLGTGYSGKVKRGVDTITGQPVALKVMDKVDLNNPSSSTKFRRLQEEVNAMKTCGDHPHTVMLHDALFNYAYPKRDGSTVDAHILVLELCPKGELFDLLHRGGVVPPVVCKEYFRQLMSGISYCHAKEVVHRDLKPENLLLDELFNLKIADFGFAASGRENMMCSSIVGSRTYMAPEVLGRRFYHCEEYDGTLADVWSAGVILFTLLAGHPPMEKADESDWWFRALKLGRQDLFWESHERTATGFPEDAKELVTFMLAVDPTSRIKMSDILRHRYLAPAAARKGGAFSWGASPSPDPSKDVFVEMQRRYEMSMASKRMCTLASSSRGTADSAGSSCSRSPVANMANAGGIGGRGAAQAGGDRSRFFDPHVQDTRRSVDGDDEPPEMSAIQAAKVTGGFMAKGRPRDVVKMLEKELFEMNAEIAGVHRDGPRTFRSSFKVSAVIPVDPKSEIGFVGMVATVFRIAGNKEEGAEDGEAMADLIVVLRRKRGDSYRYRKVEDALVEKMTRTKATREGAKAYDNAVVNMSPTP